MNRVRNTQSPSPDSVNRGKKYSHNRFQIPPQHIADGLDGKMHRAFTSYKYRSLPLPAALGNGLADANNGTGGIANAAVYGLVERHYVGGKFGVAEAKGRSPGLADDDVTWSKEGAEGLWTLSVVVYIRGGKVKSGVLTGQRKSCFSASSAGKL